MLQDVREPSQSAILLAAARALHRDDAGPSVLDDWLALPLAGDRAPSLMARLQSEVPRESVLAFARWAAVRARVCEDAVDEAIARGVGQYVILGAGLDSFAYRRTDVRHRMRVFEVDHPASQAWKRRRLDELAVACPPNLVFAPIDFEREGLAGGLDAAGFDSASPAVFAWIGVTMYLTMPAIRETLSAVAACAPGTAIVLTYNQPPSAVRGAGVQIEATLRTLLADIGEPIITRFLPGEIEQLLRDTGFADVTHFGPDEARRTYFGGRDDVLFGGVQRIAIASVPARAG